MLNHCYGSRIVFTLEYWSVLTGGKAWHLVLVQAAHTFHIPLKSILLLFGHLCRCHKCIFLIEPRLTTGTWPVVLIVLWEQQFSAIGQQLKEIWSASGRGWGEREFSWIIRELKENNIYPQITQMDTKSCVWLLPYRFPFKKYHVLIHEASS